MSLFTFQQRPFLLQKQQKLTKSQKFRLEIRKKQQDQRFLSIRKQFVQSLKSLNFLQQLNSQKDNITAKKIQWLINGLESGKNNASFYQDILDLQLQACLCQTAVDDKISIENKQKILNSLVQLTYFSHKIPLEMIQQNNLIDNLRAQISKLNLANEIQADFAYSAACLIKNLTAFHNQQFNNHMIQADFLPTLHKILDQASKSELARENQIQVRQVLLKIYSNLFKSNSKQLKFICKTLTKILSNDRNYQTQGLLCCSLLCLVEAIKCENFWSYLQTQTTEMGAIYFALMQIANKIKEQFSEQSFSFIVQFFNQLYEQQDLQIVNDFINSLPDYFLQKSLYELQKNQNEARNRKLVCKTIKMMSCMNKQFGNIYYNKIEQQQFVSAIMARYIAINPLYGKYLARLLGKMIDQDKTSVDILINNGIIDVVHDFFQSQFFKTQKLDVIDLVQKLIDTEQSMRNSNQTPNKMLNVFQDRGIITDIEKLQDDESVEVSKRSQQFITKISQLQNADNRQ